MTELVGRRLGEFEVARELGRGGMGVVYEAVQTSLNRRVALKVLGPGLGLTPRAVERFRREAEAAARLHHTNIVPVYATGEAGGVHFYAMELIDGPSLDAVINELREQRGGAKTAALAPELTATGPYLDTSTPTGSGVSSGLSSGSGYFDAVARMVADVADALHHAHQSHVIHRDIKPGNLLLGSDGRLSINDFGLARALEEPGMTTTGEFVGTPAYTAPEQIAGGRVPVDHRCDIYSLGATLYELLTLRPPFVAAQRDQLLAMVTQKEPPSPHSLNPKVPRDLETSCLKCLEKDPDRRYGNARELAEDLRRYVNRFAIQARRAGPVARVRKWVKRNPWLSAAVGCVLVAVVAAGYFAYHTHLAASRAAAERERHEEELRAERWRAAVERAYLSAMGGDFATAEDAVREAERLRASPGQLRMLRGVVAFYQGQIAAAIEHLEQAVALNPESVAARSLLAAAYGEVSKWPKYEDCLRDAERLTPTTPEDWLFRGYAKAKGDSPSGLSDLDEAFRRRPGSLLARVLRAEARGHQALDKTDAEMALAAQEEVAVVRQLLTDNPIAPRISLFVNMAVIPVYRDRGQPDRADAARRAAKRDAEALRPYGHMTDMVLNRWEFFRLERAERAMLPELERLYQKTREPVAAVYAGFTLYYAGELGRAAELLEPHRGETMAAHLLALFAAEQPGGRGRGVAILREVIGREPPSWDMFNSLCLLRLLGEPAEAASAARTFRTHPERFTPLRNRHFCYAVDHAAGDLTDDAFLATTTGSRLDRCNAEFCVGVASMARGDRDAARKHFEEAVKTGALTLYPYDLCVGFLRRMDADPNWPPWIPKRPGS